jgi:hypothetical protein
MLSYELGIKILFIAGVTNVLFLLLVFFSCRCLAGPRISNWLFKYDLFRRLYKYHCKLWWGFYASVLIHTLLAFYLFGWQG